MSFAEFMTFMVFVVIVIFFTGKAFFRYLDPEEKPKKKRFRDDRATKFYFWFNGPIKKVVVSLYDGQVHVKHIDISNKVYNNEDNITNIYERLCLELLATGWKFKAKNYKEKVPKPLRELVARLDLIKAESDDRIIEFEQRHIDYMNAHTWDQTASVKEISPRDVLGVKPNATKDQIKKRYLELVKVSHPDTHPDLDDAYIKRLNSAYEALS